MSRTDRNHCRAEVYDLRSVLWKVNVGGHVPVTEIGLYGYASNIGRHMYLLEWYESQDDFGVGLARPLPTLSKFQR